MGTNRKRLVAAAASMVVAVGLAGHGDGAVHAVHAGIRADGHELMLRQAAQLLLGERFSIDESAAIDVALLDCRPHVWEHAEILVDCGFDGPEGALLAREIRTFKSASEVRQLDLERR